MNYKVIGGKKLSGTVTTNISKNATVALLAASLLNRGTTTIKRVPKIEEVNRLIEVLKSIGAEVEWTNGDVVVRPPKKLTPEKMDKVAAGKTRSTVLFTAPLAHLFESFELPLPGGCNLGGRTMMPHIQALGALGISILKGSEGMYKVSSIEKTAGEVAMYESSDTGTESVLMAAAKIPGKTTIKYASANYMVQDLCVFLEQCGVKVEGIGTSTLVVHGVDDIDRDVVVYPSEDPIESMFFISLAATTNSEITIKRCPFDFIELELVTLGQMSQKYEYGPKYTADNGRTILTDVTMFPSKLTAPPEKIAPRPYPGINIDNLPFFVPVATQAQGRTLIHDWVYENRAIYYMEMKKLGAEMLLADPHRVFIDGPTKLHPADIEAPPALRPATIILIGMLAAEGESILRNVYPINRGYENLHERLRELGASVEAVE
ncbi:UDP-N-acetylglucosamine 1-carboxyvinyltransferase [Candidatus Kaiserbacteria bacterium RIFCSPHIGHO2_02_FULL_55_20]|uniref:UDP-N-acetylglucosamine 1-carboxyvinyltransferase n=1 Tax=Candidatus Kaiserbacteria bacterium RIFCSPHIGHO2_02_FULL_55_20 TaxID=1798497 RepID=A0A1F6DYV1_9BACT|nr:MAG: UDP-N-acetylglucosamine 1-carboxyvinyltransferase [Candidatus Kaiserbacteria bacterium RIFCSPHIGHO2_01_FULL_55_37]OGG66507.1 MAG: UDP-N-acetylglucosamine 1-carboxyvinyltransferase [Candidatus Kaiserbacteria bacterium RIFCSPHIGHO2_02_FULL_55_20]